MAGGKKPNGKSGGEDENKDLAKAAGFVVFSGIALSIIKALCPKKSIEEFVQSEDTVPSTSTGDTDGEPKEDAKVTPLSAQNIIEKTSEVQKQVNGLKTSEDQKQVNGLKTSEVQKQVNGLKSSEDQKQVNGLKTSEDQKQVNGLKTSEVQKQVNGLKTREDQKQVNGLKTREDQKQVNGLKTGEVQKQVNIMKTSEDQKQVNGLKISEVQKQEKNSEVQNKVIGFGSGISKKFQKQDSAKKSRTTIELVRGDTLWDLSHKYGVHAITTSKQLAKDQVKATTNY